LKKSEAQEMVTILEGAIHCLTLDSAYLGRRDGLCSCGLRVAGYDFLADAVIRRVFRLCGLKNRPEDRDVDGYLKELGSPMTKTGQLKRAAVLRKAIKHYRAIAEGRSTKTNNKRKVKHK